jgi:competence protein ComEA
MGGDVPIENLRVGSMVVAVALALAIAAGVWFGSRSATPDVLTSSGGVSYTTVPEAVVVHVSGAVNRPGLVTISSSARVADAIAGAGGAVAGADLAGLNLASSVRDGDQIVVPLVGAATAPGQAKDGGIDLNRATAVELEGLPGVGPVLAGRIIAYRDLHGPFAAVEDLLDVGGIGEAKLAAIRDSIAAP